MKIFKHVLLLMLLAVLITLSHVETYAQEEEQPFVELTFTINSTTYSSKGITKGLDVAPFIENESTLVPFRAIFEELGYNIEWKDEDSSITATQGKSKMILKINNGTAIVNGVEKSMSIAPKIVGGRTVVPLRFISENAGAEVKWDGELKTITITRSGKFDTGVIMFYEQNGTKSSTVYVYDGIQTKAVKLDSKDLVNWYSFKGKVLATLIDKKKRKNNFVIYEDNNFETLIDDFDIQDTFEYNDNLLIHGYDRDQKINKLYRFDGKDLKLISTNFYVGKHILIKDKLLVNKYDNNRHYTLLSFDKDSWVPKTLKDGFIITDSMEYEGILYMSGGWEEGSLKPLVAYDDSQEEAKKFNILVDDVAIDFKQTIIYKKQLYTVVYGNLMILDKNELKKVMFKDKNSSNLKIFSIQYFRKCNDKLYISVKRELVTEESTGKVLSTGQLNQLIEFDETLDYKIILDNYVMKNLIVENDKLLALGTQDNGDNALNIYDGKTLTRALDVTTIKNVLSIKDKMFIDITDTNRITNESRDTIIVYYKDTKEDKYSIKNVVVGMRNKYWAKVGDALVFAGNETDIKKDKLYSYTDKFNVETEDYIITFWNPEPEKLIMSGLNSADYSISLYRFANGKKELLSSSISITKMIKVKGNYYLVYGNVNDKNENPLNGKNVLYIYSDSSKKFYEMKADIQITDMLFVK